MSNRLIICWIGVLLSMSGCFEAPELGIEPKIGYESLVFKQSDPGVDTLTLSFTIEDGNGDIGLTSGDTYPPYHSFNLVTDTNSVIKTGSDLTLSLVTTSKSNPELPFYLFDFSSFTLFSETDSRPAYNCEDYYIVNAESPSFPFDDPPLSGGGRLVLSTYDGDTVFIQPNEFYNNLHVTFLFKNLATGEFSELDFNEVFPNSSCNLISFDGRIPIFDYGILGDPLKGVFSYFMASNGFLIALNNQTFKIRFYIYDRALNKSNVVETPEVTLQSISI